MDERGAARALEGRRGRRRELEAPGIGRDPRVLQETAPAHDLVLVLAPPRAGGRLRDVGVVERKQPPRARCEEHAVALRPPAVEVDREVGAVGPRGKRSQRRGVERRVDAAGVARERRQRRGEREDLVVPGEGVRKRPERGQGGEEVAEAEGPQREKQRPAGAHATTRAKTASQSSRKRRRP
jgi:hypothetical protein